MTVPKYDKKNGLPQFRLLAMFSNENACQNCGRTYNKIYDHDCKISELKSIRPFPVGSRTEDFGLKSVSIKPSKSSAILANGCFADRSYLCLICLCTFDLSELGIKSF